MGPSATHITPRRPRRPGEPIRAKPEPRGKRAKPPSDHRRPTYLTTAGSEEKCAAARALGADLAINYRAQDFVEEVRRVTGGRGADVVLDMVSGSYVARNLECLAEDGRHVTIAVLGGLKAEINMALVMRKRLTLTGSTLRPRSDAFKALLAEEIRTAAWPLFEDGTLAPVMDQSLALAEVAAAHRRMEEGDHIGKIVLEVAGEG